MNAHKPPSAPPPRRRVPRAVFALVVLVGVVGLIEGLLRVASASLEWRARASIAAGAGAGEWTLACSGDSVTWGFPGGPDQGYPRQLAGIAAVAGRGVVNLGLPGSGSGEAVQRAAAFLDAHPGDPVAVLHLAGFNDCADLRAGTARTSENLVSDLGHRVLSQLLLFRQLTQIVLRVVGPAHTAAPPVDDARRATCQAHVRTGVRSAAALRTRPNVRVAALTYATPRRAAPGHAESAWLTPIVNEGIRAEAQALGLPLIDVDACFGVRIAGGVVGALFTRDGLHLTEEGHAVMASCVAAGLSPLLEGRATASP